MTNDQDSASRDYDDVDEAGLDSFPASDPPSWNAGSESPVPRDPSDEKMYTSEPVEDQDGHTYVIQQQNVGPGNEAGGGEFPDPNTPPSTERPLPKRLR